MRITCPQCGFSREIPEDTLPEQAQLATCPKCDHRFRFRKLDDPDQAGPGDEPTPVPESPIAPQSQADSASRAASDQPEPKPQTAPAPDQDAPRPGAQARNAIPEVEVPFERLDRFGFFPGMGLTIRRAMLSPALFFRAMPLRGLLPPMAFYVLLFQFSLVLDMIWARVGLPPLSSLHPALAVFDPNPEAPTGPVVLFVLYPLMAAFLSLITSLLVHLVLLTMRSGERGYEATYRAMAYSNAPLALSVLPYGYLLGIPWGFWIFFVGLKNIHRTSTLRVALAFAVLLALQAALAWTTLQYLLRSQGALP